MRKMLLTAILIGLMLPLASSSSRASGQYPPLIIAIRSEGELPSYYNDDLWLWDGTSSELRQLTSYQYNGAPIISPTNANVAYLSTPSVYLQALKIAGGRSGVAPANIWLMSIPSGDAMRIADVPSGATVDADGILSIGIERSQPTWSPDGKKLAWTEITERHNTPDDEQRLMIYDLATGTTRTVLSLPVYQIGSSMPLWGEPGIALVGNDINGDIMVEIYDEFGQLLTKQPYQGSEDDFHWVKGADGVVYLASRNSLIDVSTGAVQPLPTGVALYSRTAVTGLSLERDANQRGVWILHDSDKTMTLGTEDAPVSLVAISPQGDAVAYVQEDVSTLSLNVHLYQTGQTTTIVSLSEVAALRFIDGLAWGATEWRFVTP
jgi:dipeptidyl aminopeptidase/acylaminoacyl peptidase